MIRQDWSTLKKLMFAKAAAGGAAVTEATATGNPLTFITDLARPLKSLLIPFTPKQEGTGDPSPENIRSILPWDGLNVEHASGNAFDSYVESGEYGYNTGAETPSTTRIRSKKILLCKGTYTISSIGMSNVAIYVYDVNGNFLLDESIRVWKSQTYTFNVTGLRYIAFVWRKAGDTEITPQDISNVMLSVGNTAQTYEPPAQNTVYPVAFPSPVYGGTLDVVSGVLTVEYAEVILKGTEEWFESENKFFVTSVSALKNNTAKQNIFCDLFKYSLNGADYLLQGQFTDSISSTYNIRIRKHDDAMTLQEFKSLLASNNMHIVYKLETPQTVTLTPAQLTTLVGNNTIWSDADGSMTATYLKKG